MEFKTGSKVGELLEFMTNEFQRPVDFFDHDQGQKIPASRDLARYGRLTARVVLYQDFLTPLAAY